MEGIEAEIESKSIEKSVEIKEVGTAPQRETPKPKKPRSQAQKDAFEKARKKRAENLLKKKEEEETEYEEDEVEVVAEIKPPPKRRGRPKKAMKNQEPKQVSFIPPPDPQLYSQYPYQVQNQAQPQFNPYQYWGGVPPQVAPAPAPQPVNNYYYYGEPPHAPQTSKYEREPEPSPEGSIDEDYEEERYTEEEIEYPSTEPQLKDRFA